MPGFLYVEEYADLLEDITGKTMPATDSIQARHKIPIGAASVPLGVNWQPNTRYIVIVSDLPCQYEVGDTPVADGNSRYLPANYFRVVSEKDGNSIAVIEQQ